jgi:hypothetical protein
VLDGTIQLKITDVRTAGVRSPHARIYVDQGPVGEGEGLSSLRLASFASRVVEAAGVEPFKARFSNWLMARDFWAQRVDSPSLVYH